MTRWKFASISAACFLIVLTAFLLARAQGVNYISKEQLKAELTNPDITVLDVRTPQDWNTSQWKIKGALREAPADVNQWMNKFPKDKRLVLYCA